MKNTNIGGAVAGGVLGAGLLVKATVGFGVVEAANGARAAVKALDEAADAVGALVGRFRFSEAETVLREVPQSPTAAELRYWAGRLVRQDTAEAEKQLEQAAGEARDHLLVSIAAGQIRLVGIQAYVGGPFRKWMPSTVDACRRLGLFTQAELLQTAAKLPPGSPQWGRLDDEFRAAALP